MVNVESNIFLEYVSSLSADNIHYLLTKPPSAMFIFRMLPAITQQLVAKLIWNSNVSEKLAVSEQAHKQCLSILKALYLVNDGPQSVTINPQFRNSYLRAVMHGSQRCANMKCVEVEEKKRNKAIGEKALERWECILRFLALPSEQNMSSVSEKTRKLFHNAGFTSGNNNDIEITSTGFQFLLLSPVQQMWTYIREYLRLEDQEGNDVRGVLDLLIRVILCVEKGDDPSKKSFAYDNNWSPNQQELIKHLRELGLIFIRKSKDGVFFVTPLLWHLSSGSDNNTTQSERSSGRIIVETNFRLYAYTNSSLQLAILSTFTDMTYRFNDMCVGSLSREAVRRALQVGITAAQIISFLRANAHPQCLSTSGPVNCLPITVADQIRLWEEERKRLNMDESTLYSTFESEAEFVGVRDFALSRGILLWADSNQKLVIVKEEGHSLVKEWWREQRSH